MEVSQRKPVPERDEKCEKHGAFVSRNYFGSRWSTCEACIREDREAAEADRIRQERKERRDQRLRRSGLEGRFEGATFENYVVTSAEQAAVLEACKEFAKTVKSDSGTGLWLIGPPGTGKTHLGSAMVRHIIEERDAEACIFSGRQIIRMLRATWKGNGGTGPNDGRDWDGRATTEEGLINDFGYVPLLVIDEIGLNFGTDAESVQLFDIVDLRYKHRRPTVLLSNLPASALKQAMGDRSYDRLREGAKLLACQWPSRRGGSTSQKSRLESVA